MKFLTIATGGTIASVATPDGLKPGLSGSELIARARSVSKDDSVDVIDLFSKDSTNILPEDWITIAECINNHADFFDCTIVLHGTDTMAWTASALSFLTNSPVILTGSMLPAGVDGSDADRNLDAAFAFGREIALAGRNEVALAFNGKLYDGSCVSKVDTNADDAFYSWSRPHIGELTDGRYHLTAASDQLKLSPKERVKIFANISKEGIKKIALVPIFPGLKASILNSVIDGKPSIVVLEGLGGGGVPFDGDEENLLPCIDRAVKENITVVLGTGSPFGGTHPDQYEVGVRALRAGAISAGSLTREALIVKLILGIEL